MAVSDSGSFELQLHGILWVYLGDVVHTPTPGEVELLEDNVVIVTVGGEIGSVTKNGNKMADLLAEAEAAGRLIKGGWGKFLMPGLIDTHVHAPQFVYTGTGTDTPLFQWLDKYAFPAEQRLADDSARAYNLYRRVVECTLCHGTTSAVYFGSMHQAPNRALVDVVLERGQRGFIGKVNLDRNAPEDYKEGSEGSLCDTEEFIQWVLARSKAGSQEPHPVEEGGPPVVVQGRPGGACAGGLPLVTPVVTPRFLPTCTMELLKGLGDLAHKYDIPVQSHIAESAGVVAFSREQSGEHGGHRRELEAFDQCGLLTGKTILAHGVHLSDEELRLCAARGTAIAHCPLSNFFFANGVFRAREAGALGVKVALGTDVAGGYSPSMLNAIRNSVIAARALHEGTDRWKHGTSEAGDRADNGAAKDGGAGEEAVHDLSWKDGLYMATMGGAQALGLQERLGSIKQGKMFDALFVDVSRGGPGGMIHAFEDTDSKMDVLQKFINLGDDRHIVAVFVQGRRVILDGVVVSSS